MNNESLQKFLKELPKSSQIRVKCIGKSVQKRKICAVLIEKNPCAKWALITSGIHAREHLSCDLVCRLIVDFIKMKNCDFNVAFVPLVNPDGANLCVNGLKNLSQKQAKKLIQINKSCDFALYKANARGVDLNNNWDANWKEKHTTKTAPASSGFYGYKPMSEPEVLALEKFTQRLKPAISISYHLKGEEIYFDFFQNEANYARDEKIAQIFAEATEYKIKSTQYVSSGGFKDWCVQKLHIPALTIEVGEDKFSHPFPESEIKQIYEKNKTVFDCLAKSFQSMKTHK